MPCKVTNDLTIAMSEEQLNAFLAELAQKPALQRLLQEEDADILAIAAAAGFQLSVEDIRGSLELSDHELSSEELERVAGGDLIAMLNRAAIRLNSLRLKSQECVSNPLSTNTSQNNDSKSSWCQSGKDMCTYQ